MIMTMQLSAKASILGAAMLVAPVLAHAQGADIGKEIYNSECAVCHGVDGKGNGPLNGVLTEKVADLTVLQKNNNGVFPFSRIYGVIDGREAVRSHGPREMPIWGNYFNEKAPQASPPWGTQAEYATSFVRGRILALIGYIDTLQVK
jgi:mono/diheme cytochrome c family protein